MCGLNNNRISPPRPMACLLTIQLPMPPNMSGLPREHRHGLLDGNGHVQRAVFAVIATEFGFPLSPRFAFHPQPFGRLLASALETFSRVPKGKEDEELDIVAELSRLLPRWAVHCPRSIVAGRVALLVVKAPAGPGSGSDYPGGHPSVSGDVAMDLGRA